MPELWVVGKRPGETLEYSGSYSCECFGGLRLVPAVGIIAKVGYDTECSFCGKAKSEIKCLIGASGGVEHPRNPHLSICEECVSLCVSILADNGVELPPPYPDPA